MVYNPSEPRDPLGKWMKAHGGNPKASLADNVKNLNCAEEHGAAVDVKNTPTAVIDQIARNGNDRDNQLEALMNPKVSSETLNEFRYSDDARERAAVAYNPSLDGKTLDMMSDDDNNGVKIAVAQNRNTMNSTLERLRAEGGSVGEYASMSLDRNHALEAVRQGRYEDAAKTFEDRKNLFDKERDRLDYDPYGSPDEEAELNERVAFSDAYATEVATEAAKRGDYDAALNIFDRGHSEWNGDCESTYPLTKGKVRSSAASIEATNRLADQFMSNASDSQCDRLYELSKTHNAEEAVRSRFTMEGRDQPSYDAARQSDTKPYTLDWIAKSNDVESRRIVADNPSTSDETLKRLSEDKDETTSRKAVMNLEHRRENHRLSDEYTGVDFNDDSGYGDIQFEY